MSRIKRASPALVISILALIAALVVPALAQVATTALTKKEKRVVRKIARVQVKKLAPGLAVARARSAGNAEKVDGQDASDFTPAGEVHSPGRVVLNDPTPGDIVPQISIMFTAGAFSIEGVCADNFGGGKKGGRHLRGHLPRHPCRLA